MAPLRRVPLRAKVAVLSRNAAAEVLGAVSIIAIVGMSRPAVWGDGSVCDGASGPSEAPGPFDRGRMKERFELFGASTLWGAVGARQRAGPSLPSGRRRS